MFKLLIKIKLEQSQRHDSGIIHLLKLVTALSKTN